MIEFVLFTIACACVFSYHTYRHYEFKLQELDRTTVLHNDTLEAIKKLWGESQSLVTRLDETSEFQRKVLQTFLSSMTEIVSLSVEEKKHMENKLAASKLNKMNSK